MKIVSVFNSVLGPVMRGPSSSHTAGSYHIGRIARDACGGVPERVVVSFDAGGSYGKVFREQGSDRAFISGLMDWDLLDDSFHDAAAIAAREGVEIAFEVGGFPEADHPNWTELRLYSADGAETRVVARSVGGGSIVVSSVDGFAVDLRGDAWTTLIRCGEADCGDIGRALEAHGRVESSARDGVCLLVLKDGRRPPEELLSALRARGVSPRVVRPIFFPVRGEPVFHSAEGLERYAAERGISAGEAALDYECALLGISQGEAMEEMWRRYGVMKRACERALRGELAASMQLLRPTAERVWKAGGRGALPFFGPHTRAAARAMAIMHANGGMDVVCAAPTGGSAGALPGTVITLEETLGLARSEVCMALWAAGAVGLILDIRATFAAEVAGCQVEIGAGGAMASAACVQAVGGTVRQAMDAAAISFQNTMGSVCDLVQGMVELPCHTRNAAAAAGAFVNADLILGGYENPVPLDETIDAVYAVGQMLPPELRCTSQGGLALCPSALAMPRLR